MSQHSNKLGSQMPKSKPFKYDGPMKASEPSKVSEEKPKRKKRFGISRISMYAMDKDPKKLFPELTKQFKLNTEAETE